MIHHIVLFRFKPGTTPAQIAAAGQALLGMRAGIPYLRSGVWGPNLARGAGDFTHVWLAELDDMDAVNRYSDDPVHVAVVRDALEPIREARLVVDVEV